MFKKPNYTCENKLNKSAVIIDNLTKIIQTSFEQCLVWMVQLTRTLDLGWGNISPSLYLYYYIPFHIKKMQVEQLP